MTQIKDLEIVKTSAENGDYFVMQSPVTGETYKITKADLFAGLSTGTGSTNHVGAYSDDGDTNGVFYYLGRQLNTAPWVNPYNNGVTITASGVESGSLAQLTDRSGSDFWTPSANGSFVMFHLDTGKLKCNYYSVKSRANSAGYYPRNWKLEASVNGSEWFYLHNHVNDTSLNGVNQWASFPIETTIAASYFRLTTTGVNSDNYYHLCLGEVEFYGTFTPN
ncbi:MAG: discoidin domain-containing protein [Nostoc sp.]|uniref:discoidin domain-containing protein n=1 Tax=Nostoc sp. TaxID=1180 RepID=UPI002FFBCB7B